MLTSKSGQQVDIPAEPGEWADIKALSYAEREEAQQVHMDRVLRQFKELSADGMRALTDQASSAEKSIAVKEAEEVANPLASVDVRTVLQHGLKKLSYDGGTDVTPAVVDDLDADTAVALAELIMGLSRRTVEEGKE